MNLTDKRFHDEAEARQWLEEQRWPDGPQCTHCNSYSVTPLQGKAHRPGVYQCNDCRKQFSVTTGSVMERTRLPLTKWVAAMYLMSSSKKGVSAHQLHRTLGITYQSAWFLAHRIREAMDDSKDYGSNPMGGEGKAVLADETYTGQSKKSKFYKKGLRYKWSVVALVNPENGEARAFHVKRADKRTVREILVRNATRKSILVTDDAHLYRNIGPEFAEHKKVRHIANRYVTDDGYTTNPVENFFSIFKRGMRGVYQHCSEAHLQRYLHEFDFRYSYRHLDDTERTAEIVRGASGKRLTYRRTDATANA